MTTQITNALDRIEVETLLKYLDSASFKTAQSFREAVEDNNMRFMVFEYHPEALAMYDDLLEAE
jgi:hypothetical protein